MEKVESKKSKPHVASDPRVNSKMHTAPLGTVTINEAAAKLGILAPRLRAMARKGQIDVVVLGGRRFIALSTLAALLNPTPAPAPHTPTPKVSS